MGVCQEAKPQNDSSKTPGWISGPAVLVTRLWRMPLFCTALPKILIFAAKIKKYLSCFSSSFHLYCIRKCECAHIRKTYTEVICVAQEHRSTKRVIDIFELLACTEKADGYSLTEISLQLGAPKSSLFPILHTLVNGFYLQYDPITMKYTIGRRLFEVGSNFAAKDNFYTQALTIMQEIVDRCSEACHIAELQGINVHYLMKVDTPEPIRMHSAPGKLLPANATALGKALLSSLTFTELQELYRDGLPRITENTIVNINELYQQLTDVRKTGIAYEKEENYRLIQCMATPIYKDGKPAFALGISMPTFRATPENQALMEELLLTARKRLESIV